MKKTSKIILTTIIAVSILLGIGFAAIQNITLNISGTAVADPNQANFNVKFTGTPTVSNVNNVTANITDNTNATIDVFGLLEVGQSATATYNIANESKDLSANLAATTTNSNTEYFKVTSNLEKDTLGAEETTTLTVTVELIKTPIAEIANSTIGVQIEAEPIQPTDQ